MATDHAAYELGIKFNLNISEATGSLDVLQRRVEEIFVSASQKAIKFDINLSDVSKKAADVMAASAAAESLTTERTIATQAAPPASTATEIASPSSALPPAAAPTAAIDRAAAVDTAAAMEELYAIGAKYENKLDDIAAAMDRFDQSTDAGERATWQLSRQVSDTFDIYKNSILLQQKMSRQYHISESDTLALEEAAYARRNAENALQEALERRLKFSSAMTDLEKKAIGIALQRLKIAKIEGAATDEVTKDIIAKGKASRILSTVTQSLATVSGEASGGINALAASIRTAIFSESLFAAFLPMITISLQELIAIEDQYAKANFRAAGSVNELMNVNVDLQGRLALTSSEAQKTVAAMVDAGIGLGDFADKSSKSFEDAGVAVKQFSVITGVSEQAVAKFTKKALATIGPIDKTRKVLSSLVSVMKTSGLSAGDMEGVLGKLDDQLMAVGGAYGKNSAENYSKAMVIAAGTAKRLGLEIETLTSLVESTQSPWEMLDSKWMVLNARAGNLKDSFGDAFDPLAAQSKNWDQMATDMDKAAASGANAQRQVKRLAAQWGDVSEKEVFKIMAAYKKAGGTVEAWKKAQKELEDKAKEGADLNEQWAEATNTLIMAIKKLVLPIVALVSAALVPLIVILEYTLIPVLGLVVKAFEALEPIAPIIGIVAAAFGALYYVPLLLNSIAAASVTSATAASAAAVAAGGFAFAVAGETAATTTATMSSWAWIMAKWNGTAATEAATIASGGFAAMLAAETTATAGATATKLPLIATTWAWVVTQWQAVVAAWAGVPPLAALAGAAWTAALAFIEFTIPILLVVGALYLIYKVLDELGIIDVFINALNELWVVVKSLFEPFVNLFNVLSKQTAMWKTLAAVIGVILLPFLWPFIKTMLIIYGVIKLVTWIIQGLAGTISVAFKLLGMLFAPVIKAFDLAWTAIAKLWSTIKKAFTPLERLLPVLKFIGAILIGIILVPMLVLLSPIIALFYALSGILQLIALVVEGVAWAFDKLFGWIGSGISSAIDSLASLKDSFGVVGDAVKWVSGLLFGSGFLHINEGVKNALPSFDAIAAGFGTIGDAASWAGNTIGDAASALGDWLMPDDPLAALGLSEDDIAKVNAQLGPLKAEPLAPVKLAGMDDKETARKRADEQKLAMADKTNKAINSVLGKINPEKLDAILDLLAPALGDIISKLDKDKSLSSNISQWA